MKTSFKVSKRDVIEVRESRGSRLESVRATHRSTSKITIGKLSAKDINNTWKRTVRKANEKS
jgi:hypothetical protein